MKPIDVNSATPVDITSGTSKITMSAAVLKAIKDKAGENVEIIGVIKTADRYKLGLTDTLLANVTGEMY